MFALNFNFFLITGVSEDFTVACCIPYTQITSIKKKGIGEPFIFTFT